MPLYEYECESCGVRFERRQHMEDEPVEECPECGGRVHRLIQPVGIIFRGSGFYVTDNRSKSPISTPGTVKESTDTSKSDNADPSSDDSRSKASSSTD